MYDYNGSLIGDSYFEGVTRPCKVCKRYVVISPNNSTWGGLHVRNKNYVGFSIQAPCEHCGSMNHYVWFIKKSELSMSDGEEAWMFRGGFLPLSNYT